MLEGKHLLIFDGIMVVIILLSIVMSKVSNLNLVSIHRVYRDRLMEAFMPDAEKVQLGRPGESSESTWRFALAELIPGADTILKNCVMLNSHRDDVVKERQRDRLRILYEFLSFKCDVKNKTDIENATFGPFPLINANVVMVNAEDSRRRFRGGDNFILSPYVCGSTATGYVPTAAFMADELTLATAMAVSGAAVNPYTGASGFGPTRHRAVSAVMTLFNMRLGLWVRNPSTSDDDGSGSRRPTAWTPGLATLWPGAKIYHEDTPWQELTDGGHFAQLGLYELVRRRCPLIICVDAGEDGDYGYRDVTIELRRIEQDFRVRCLFGEDDTIRPTKKGVGFAAGLELCEKPYVVGKLLYPTVDNGEGKPHLAEFEGMVIYLKSSLFQELPLDVLTYARQKPKFPHQTTVDQLFDEVQFEAYRQLGWAIAQKMLDDGVLKKAREDVDAKGWKDVHAYIINRVRTG